MSGGARGEERREEQGGGGKEHEGDVARDKCAELFRGQLCPLCLGEGNTQRAYLPPEKFSKIVLFPGGVSFGPSQSGGGELPSTRLRGEQGEAPSKGCRGEKPHDTTQHHTHSKPPQTAPQHTNHRHTDTPHGTSPHQEPQNTTPGITPTTKPTEALLPKKRNFFRKCTFFETPPNPAKVDPKATTIPGRCILLERGHPFIPK